MTCGEAAHLIYLYCARKPNDPETRQLAAHIAFCPPCRRFMGSMEDRFQRGDAQVECSEIPVELMDVLTRIVRDRSRPAGDRPGRHEPGRPTD